MTWFTKQSEGTCAEGFHRFEERNDTVWVQVGVVWERMDTYVRDICPDCGAVKDRATQNAAPSDLLERAQ